MNLLLLSTGLGLLESPALSDLIQLVILSPKDNTWISFDVCWTPNGSVHAEYRLRSFDDCCKRLVDWRLTEEEQEIILDKMEEYCMQETGKTLQELWDSYEVE